LRLPRTFGTLGLRRAIWCAGLCVAAALGARPAAAEGEEPAPRDAQFTWDEARRYLYLGVSFRDAIDETIQQKLRRGLPTTIVLTAAIYAAGGTEPLSTTAQSCKVTWHVWEEIYIVEVTRPNLSRVEKTLTVNGVLRRCAEVQATQARGLLLAGNSTQIPFGVPLLAKAKVQVNPMSPELLSKIKRWVSRPTGTATAAPGDALFSTFTGLFLQRIGEAERELDFSTKAVLPVVPRPRAR
jgi:hypothetical protein